MDDVVIQGAGIGGLTLAIALEQRGYAVKVVERSAAPSAAGAGILMAANAMQVFGRLGIAAQVQHAGWPIRRFRLQDDRGFDLQVTDFAKAAETFGCETVAIHRAALEQVLLEQVQRDTVRFGVEIDGVHDAAGPLSIRLSNGETLHAEVLVGADGIHSGLRRVMAWKAKKRYSGSSSYRAIARGAPVAPDASAEEAREIWSKGCRLGACRINAEDTYWYMTFNAPEGVRSTAQESQAYAATLFRSYFAGWSHLLSCTAADEILRTDISDLHRLPAWSSGRVGLIGDAAHATTPNLGQGGAMAVEDALALADAFDSDGLTPGAFARYETRRRAKVDWTVSTSRSIGRLCHLSNPVARAVRNAVMLSVPGWVGEAQTRRLYTVA